MYKKIDKLCRDLHPKYWTFVVVHHASSMDIWGERGVDVDPGEPIVSDVMVSRDIVPIVSLVCEGEAVVMPSPA